MYTYIYICVCVRIHLYSDVYSDFYLCVLGSQDVSRRYRAGIARFFFVAVFAATRLPQRVVMRCAWSVLRVFGSTSSDLAHVACCCFFFDVAIVDLEQQVDVVRDHHEDIGQP